jgi:hypothetical protein
MLSIFKTVGSTPRPKKKKRIVYEQSNISRRKSGVIIQHLTIPIADVY